MYLRHKFAKKLFTLKLFDYELLEYVFYTSKYIRSQTKSDHRMITIHNHFYGEWDA